MKSNGTDEFWSEKEVANYLNRSRETLRSWRRNGTGPEFVTDPKGRIHYPKIKVQEWVKGE